MGRRFLFFLQALGIVLEFSSGLLILWRLSLSDLMIRSQPTCHSIIRKRLQAYIDLMISLSKYLRKSRLTVSAY